MSRLDAVQYIAHGIAKVAEVGDDKVTEDTDQENVSSFEEQKALNIFCVNLNEKAKIGKIDKLIGRKKEVDRTIQILCRRQKNNPLFVGDAGVGKTAIAEGLAKRIIEDDVPEVMKNSVHKNGLNRQFHDYGQFCN